MKAFPKSLGDWTRRLSTTLPLQTKPQIKIPGALWSAPAERSDDGALVSPQAIPAELKSGPLFARPRHGGTKPVPVWSAAATWTRLMFLAVLSALAFGAIGSGSGLMQRVASWPGTTRGPVSGIDVSGHYGFVAMGEGGLSVLDLADPAKPVRVGGYLPPGRTEMVQIVGSRAYLGTLVHVGGGCEQEAWRSYLLILDISDPLHPTLLGRYSTILQMYSLFVDGNLAYIGETGPELSAFRIVDVSNPARPVARRVERNGGASAVWSTGNRAYVCAWSVLRVLDVTQPSSPVVLTNVDLSVQALCGVSNRLYTVDSSRFSVYDIGSNVAPTLLGTFPLYPLASSPVSLHVSGDRAYVAGAQDGLLVIDVSNPAKPVYLGSCDTPGCATAVRTFGHHALVADSYGVQVIDVSDPAKPILVSEYDTGLTTRGIRVSNGRAYVMSADTDRGFGVEARSRLEILDVNNPTQPVLLGSYEKPGFIQAMEISGNLAYLMFSSGVDGPGLEIVDVGYPPDPLLLSRTSLAGEGDFSRIGISIAGKYAYVGRAGYGVQVFDVSTPTKPVRLNQVATPSDCYAVQVVGDRVYAGSDGGIELLDVTDPAVPAYLGGATFEQGGGGGACVRVCDGYAYSGVGWNGFTITDVRSSSNPVVAGAYDTLGEVRDLCLADGRAFVAEGWQGLTVFDVSAPGHPTALENVQTCGQAYGVQVCSNCAFVAEGGSGLGILSLAPGPLLIIQDPISNRAAAGETTTLKVSAYGRGQLSYQWYAGSSGDVSHPLAGATEPCLVTPVCTQAAAYWVRVSSSSGMADSRTAWVNPAPPVSVELVGIWPGYRRSSAADVELAGNLAYVAAGSLQIWDVGDPASAHLVGTYDPQGAAVSWVTLSGNQAFLSCGDQLHVVDVSHPEAPAPLGHFTATNGFIGKVVVVGATAFLAGDSLRILDVSDPSKPLELSNLSASGNALDVNGRYACLVNAFGSLEIFDVLNAAQPLRVAGGQIFDAAPDAIRISGNYAYVAEGQRNDTTPPRPGILEVVDISKPAQPRIVGRIRVTGTEYANDVAIAGSYAYLTDSAFGLVVVDISKPTAPQCVGALNSGSAMALAVSGQRACLATSEGLQMVDISAPASPELAQPIHTRASVEDVACFGHHALVAEGERGLAILDVSDPRQPALLGAYRTNGYARRVVVNGSVACFLDDALELLDVSDPARPTCLGTFFLDTPADTFAATGEYAYFGGSPLATVDIRNPSEPKLLSVDSVDVIDSTGGVALSPPYLFVAQGWEGMQTIDISVPAEPRRLGAYYSEAPVSDVAVRNDLACLVVGSEMPMIEVVDIQDRWNPTRAASIPLPLANKVAFMGSYALVTGDGLQVFDLSNPQQPLHVGSRDPGWITGRLHPAGDLVYVAAGDCGLAIYRVSPQLRLDPPVLDSNGMLLSWQGGPGIRLQQAPSLDDPVWRDVPYSEGASSFRCSLTNKSAFFRLVRP